MSSSFLLFLLSIIFRIFPCWRMCVWLILPLHRLPEHVAAMFYLQPQSETPVLAWCFAATNNTVRTILSVSPYGPGGCSWGVRPRVG